MIGVSHTACKDEFRRILRSHSWSVFSFFIIYFSFWWFELLVFPGVVGAWRYMVGEIRGGELRESISRCRQMLLC